MAQKRSVNQTLDKKGLGFLLAGSFCLVLFLLLLVAVSPSSALVSKEAKEQGAVSLNTEQAFKVDAGDARQIYPYNTDHVIKLSGSLVSYLSFQGKEEISVPINCQNPFLTINGQYILVADEDGFNFYLLNAKGLVLRGKTDSPIRGAAVSETGKTAFIMDELRTKGVLRVLDEHGKHILDWRVRDRLRSGYILNMAFSADSKFIDVSQVNTDGAYLQAIMTRLDLVKATISSSLLQPGNGLYPMIYSLPDKEVLLLNSDTVVRNQQAEVQKWLSFTSIREAACGKQGLAVLGRTRDDDPEQLYYCAYNDPGNLTKAEALTGTKVGSSPHALTAGFGKISVAADDGVYIMKENNIRDANFYSAGSRVIRQAFLSENHLLLVCENSVQIIRV